MYRGRGSVTVYANSSITDWEGFTGVGYTLDTAKFLAMPLEVARIDHITKARTTTDETVQSFLRCVGNVSKGNIDSEGIWTKVTTDDATYTILGPLFTKSLATLILNNGQEFDEIFCYIDSDSLLDYPHNIYTFFVVRDGEVDEELLCLSDTHSSGFDPRIFVPFVDWASPRTVKEPYSAEAAIAFYYRKFYTESRVGQAMIHRRDQPPLFHAEDLRKSSSGAAPSRQETVAVSRTSPSLIGCAVIAFLLGLLFALAFLT